ncbi:nucleotidyltransferase domain-containing protein [Roseateles sp. NT4]|uniref:nucleotidyltransferase domain-containing protein n=1 Tax=Roseateles sp. NT4 TaxID=3453715 RepID=UPI003EF00703
MKQPLLVELLLDPTRAAQLSASDWDLLIRQARRANLIARLATQLDPQLETLPAGPVRHLRAALLIARRQRLATRWEADCLRAALQPLGIQPILLKGAAYLLADLPAAQGRLFGDVDLLVPKAQIEAAEAGLVAAGWDFDDELSDYDRRYYRQWMHEIPPLRHRQRETALDLHHTILPPTARIKVNTAALFEDARELADLPGLFVLAPVTMFLHSAAHLFHEGELDNGLRDLFDLDALLRDFGADPAFWTQLAPRAQVLGLTTPLFLALRYTTRLLGTPVPLEVMRQADAARPGNLAWLDACYERALMPVHASCDGPLTAPARLALYVRSHWLRMPVGLLARHLARKAWLRLQPPAEAQAA